MPTRILIPVSALSCISFCSWTAQGRLGKGVSKGSGVERARLPGYWDYKHVTPMSADCVAYCFNNNVPNWFICGLNACRDISARMYSTLCHALCIINGNDPWGMYVAAKLL